jgi:DnaJ-class molecular chaperone
MKCHTCDGNGIINWPSEDGGSPDMICPDCNGTRKVYETIEIEPHVVNGRLFTGMPERNGYQ